MVSIFIDTNVYLHNISFTQIKWGEIVGDNNFNIIVPVTVMTELDRKKTHHQKKVSDKAKGTLEKFNRVLKGEKIENLDIILHSIKPKKDTYETYELSSEDADDRILATILEYKANDRKVLLSNDLAIKVRASQLGIEFFDVPEKYLSTEQSDEEKKIIELTNKLRKETLKSPKPQITFTNKSRFCQFEKKELTKNISEQEYINRENSKIKLVPYVLEDPILQFSHSLESLRTYNKRLDDYKKDVIIYFKDCYYYGLYTQRTYQLELLIDNSLGTTPLQNAEITLSFPEDIHFSKALLSTPQHPEQPFLGSYTIDSRIRRNYSNLNYENIFIRDRKSITFMLEDLKHHKELVLPTVFFTFNNDVRNFSIEYALIADNLTEKLVDSLNIEIVDNNV